MAGAVSRATSLGSGMTDATQAPAAVLDQTVTGTQARVRAVRTSAADIARAASAALRSASRCFARASETAETTPAAAIAEWTRCLVLIIEASPLGLRSG
jgi:hypothetical protein